MQNTINFSTNNVLETSELVAFMRGEQVPDFLGIIDGIVGIKDVNTGEVEESDEANLYGAASLRIDGYGAELNIYPSVDDTGNIVAHPCYTFDENGDTHMAEAAVDVDWASNDWENLLMNDMTAKLNDHFGLNA